MTILNAQHLLGQLSNLEIYLIRIRQSASKTIRDNLSDHEILCALNNYVSRDRIDTLKKMR